MCRAVLQRGEQQQSNAPQGKSAKDGTLVDERARCHGGVKQRANSLPERHNSLARRLAAPTRPRWPESPLEALPHVRLRAEE